MGIYLQTDWTVLAFSKTACITKEKPQWHHPLLSDILFCLEQEVTSFEPEGGVLSPWLARYIHSIWVGGRRIRYRTQPWFCSRILTYLFLLLNWVLSRSLVTESLLQQALNVQLHNWSFLFYVKLISGGRCSFFTSFRNKRIKLHSFVYFMCLFFQKLTSVLSVLSLKLLYWLYFRLGMNYDLHIIDPV